MNVSNTMLARALVARLDTGASVADVAQELAAYLVTQRRTKDADSVLRQVERLRSQAGSIELEVTTVHGLGEALKAQITQLFGQDTKHIIINENQDAGVLGGVLVESAEKRLDLTVRRQLQRLKEMGV